MIFPSAAGGFVLFGWAGFLFGWAWLFIWLGRLFIWLGRLFIWPGLAFYLFWLGVERPGQVMGIFLTGKNQAEK